MERKFSYHDKLRWELFEKLLPKMLYYGDDEMRNRFFCSLRGDAQTLVYVMYECLCSDDNVECRYKAEDFKAEAISRGNIGMVKIQMPEHNPNISDILRVYAVYPEKADEPSYRLYFMIKQFADGRVFLMYVNQKVESFKVEELTGRMGSMEYEYWRVAASYVGIICDMAAGVHAAGRSWSRDWDAFDWEAVSAKLEKGEEDIGITRDEYMEFLEWYALNDPKGYSSKAMYIILKELDAPDKKALYLSEHMDELLALLMGSGDCKGQWENMAGLDGLDWQ